MVEYQDSSDALTRLVPTTAPVVVAALAAGVLYVRVGRETCAMLPAGPDEQSPRAAAARLSVVAAGAVALVAAAGGGEALWVAVSAMLLACALAPAHRAAIAVAATLAAALAPELLIPSLAPIPQPALTLPLLALTAATILILNRRAELEQRRLRSWALRDALTGLCNRRAVDERLAYELARHARANRELAVLALDLDGFKGVNDRFGHQAGDELLVGVAGAMTAAVRRQDTVARLGGDEFIVLAPETDADGALELARKIQAAIGRVTAGFNALSASTGTAVFPDDGTTAEDLLAAADEAAVLAKRRARVQRGRASRRAA